MVTGLDHLSDFLVGKLGEARQGEHVGTRVIRDRQRECREAFIEQRLTIVWYRVMNLATDLGRGKVLLKLTSEAHGVAPKLIANVDDLEAIAADDAADVPALTGWRRKLFGENALKLKRGEIALKLSGRSVRIVAGSAESPSAEAAE